MNMVVSGQFTKIEVKNKTESLKFAYNKCDNGHNKFDIETSQLIWK